MATSGEYAVSMSHLKRHQPHTAFTNLVGVVPHSQRILKLQKSPASACRTGILCRARVDQNRHREVKVSEVSVPLRWDQGGDVIAS